MQAPCQHNFCLKCFQGLIAKSKNKACPSCRHAFGAKFCENPRINTALAAAIRAFKAGSDSRSAMKAFVRIGNDDRPDQAFTTERAQRSGRANAASGRIMVSVPNDHFGPIPPEADPRGLGVSVGEWWKDRLDCRQWGAHFPHVAGIAGQSNVGAQSVVLSGGYEDDRDEGEWFLYTGSGGRDLSGNKRTNKVQSFDQTFEAMNKALKLSCEKGLPVRVVRSWKEKRSAYAPSEDTPVRYDGIYRIVKCWRKKGRQGLLMCRYLFVRADNEPAPWSSEETGDRPGLEEALPAPALAEMKKASKKIVYSMCDKPYWDWNEETKAWGWAKPPPLSRKSSGGSSGKGTRRKLSEHERALREMTCGICKGILQNPVSAPCGHNMCKSCLQEKFGEVAFEVDAGLTSGRSLRIRKVAIQCPYYGCTMDIAEFLKTAQVNRDMALMIERLRKEVAASEAARREEEGDVETEMTVDELTQGQEKVSGTISEGLNGPMDTENDVCIGGESQETQASSTSKSAARFAQRNQGTASADPTKDIDKEPLAVEGSTRLGLFESNRQITRNASSQYASTSTELAAAFPDFDTGLVQALVEQEEGDAVAVRIALTRMRNDVLAEERRKAKVRKCGEENGSGDSTCGAGRSCRQAGKRGNAGNELCDGDGKGREISLRRERKRTKVC